MINNNCPACQSINVQSLITLPSQFHSGQYLDTISNPQSPIELKYSFCINCDFIFYSGAHFNLDYTNAQRSSKNQLPKYKNFLLQLISNFKGSNHDLIIEIGSNDGTFLKELKSFSFYNLLGIEPSVRLSKLAINDDIFTLNEYFDSDCVNLIKNKFEIPSFIICRHTLEHISDPFSFLKNIRNLMGSNSYLLLEVPNTDSISINHNFHEFWDEHFSYFNVKSLSLLLESLNFNILKLFTFSHYNTSNLVFFCDLKDSNNSNLYLHSHLNQSNLSYLNYSYLNKCNFLKNLFSSLNNQVFIIGCSHPQVNYISYYNLASFIDFYIDDDNLKIEKFPSLLNNRAKIISTNFFMNYFSHGTVINLAFGYHAWSNAIETFCISKNIEFIDLTNLGVIYEKS